MLPAVVNVLDYEIGKTRGKRMVQEGTRKGGKEDDMDQELKAGDSSLLARRSGSIFDSVQRHSDMS